MPSPITINVNFIDLVGNAIQGYVRAAIVPPTGVFDLYVTGTGLIVPKTVTSTTGTSVSFQVWGNDVVVDAADGAKDTYYDVSVFDTLNNLVWRANYLFTGAGPINLVGFPILNPVPAPNPPALPVTFPPGGNNSDVQFNNGGVFGGTDLFNWANTVKGLFIGPQTATFGTNLSTYFFGGNPNLQVNRHVLLADADTLALGAGVLYQIDKDIPGYGFYTAVDFTNNISGAVIGIQNDLYYNVPTGHTNTNIQTSFENNLTAYGAGTSSGAASYYGFTQNTGSGIITTASCFLAAGVGNFGSGSVTNAFGFQAFDLGGVGGTLTAAFKAEAQTAGGFGFYSAGGPNFFNGQLTINGNGLANTFPLTLTSQNTGSANVGAAVIVLKNTSGTTPSYIIKDASDNLTIRTDSLSISASPSIQLNKAAALNFNVPNCGNLYLPIAGPGFGGGVNQAVLNLFQTGSIPHGFWVKADSQQMSIFFSVDDGSITQTEQPAASYVLTQVSVSGGTTTYLGTISGGGGGALNGHPVVITGFTNGGNNVTGFIVASTATQFTMTTTTQVNETHAGAAAVNQPSPSITANGSYWNGAAAVTDTTTIQNVIGAGTTPTSIFTISNTGAFSWGGVSILGALKSTTHTLTAGTPTGSSGQVSFGTTAGFGNGAAGTAVTTTLKNTGSGPTTPQTVVNYLEIDIAGVKYWIPLTQ